MPAGDDNEAIIGRGPNILLRDRARLLAERRRLRLDQPVGPDQPNEPGDVAGVEAVLKQTGDLSFRRESDPIGLLSRPLLSAIEGFQSRRNLSVDGVINPDGETVQALENESFSGEDGDARRREVVCIQNRVRRDNKQIEIDEAQEDFEVANARVVALSEEADRLNFRNDLQLGDYGDFRCFPCRARYPGRARHRRGAARVCARGDFGDSSAHRRTARRR